MTTRKKGGAQPAMEVPAPENLQPQPAGNPSTPDQDKADVLKQIDPRLIDRSPFQHRTVFDAAEMDELKTDIGKQGIHTPLIVRRHPAQPDRYELATGERRLRCAADLSLPLVPAFIRALTDRQVQELQWSENFRRSNPNPLDEAKGLRYMLAHHKSAEGLARYVNKPRAYILTRLQLLDLIEPIQEMVHAGVFNLKDSLEIACLDAKSQEGFFDEHCKDWKEKKRFRIGDLESALYAYRCDLGRALFDLQSKDLVPEAGACSRCPYNSAVYQSLFPETEKRAVCNRQECYSGKTLAQLRKNLHELIGVQLPTGIVLSGRMESEWQVLLDEIPGSSSWPRYNWSDVNSVHTPEPPARGQFRVEGLVDAFDEGAYNAAVAEYQTDLAEYDEAIKDGRIVKALCINGHRLKMKDFEVRPPLGESGDIVPSVATAEAVKNAIREGTATPTLLAGEITRLRDRETRSQELDQEKIQKEVHTQVEKRITDPAAPATLTPGDQLGIRLLIYQSLDYAGRMLLHDQVPYEEISADKIKYPLTDWLDGLTEAQVAFMTRLATHRKSESHVPDSPAAITLVRIATDTGLDVPAIRAAQEKIAADRQTRMTERITGLEAKITGLKEKAAEPVS